MNKATEMNGLKLFRVEQVVQEQRTVLRNFYLSNRGRKDSRVLRLCKTKVYDQVARDESSHVQRSAGCGAISVLLKDQQRLSIGSRIKSHNKRGGKWLRERQGVTLQSFRPMSTGPSRPVPSAMNI